MNAPDRIVTDRLILRRPLGSDAEAIFARYASDRDVTRYLAWPRHESIDQTRGFLTFSDAEWRAWPVGPLLIESRDSGALLGSTGFAFETADVAATGYVLAKDEWGKGYASEALRSLLTLAPKVGLRRVYALCHHEHVASQRVLQKCGFVIDAPASKDFLFPNLDAERKQPTVCYAWGG